MKTGSVKTWVIRASGIVRLYPYLSPAHARLLARVGVALLFLLHAVVRVVQGTIPSFAAFMENVGFPNGTVTVWAITLAELGASAMLALGRNVRIAAFVLSAIAIGGIALIHRHFGWFVGEHGTGGSEYSVALLIILVIIAATEPQQA